MRKVGAVQGKTCSGKGRVVGLVQTPALPDAVKRGKNVQDLIMADIAVQKIAMGSCAVLDDDAELVFRPLPMRVKAGLTGITRKRPVNTKATIERLMSRFELSRGDTIVISDVSRIATGKIEALRIMKELVVNRGLYIVICEQGLILDPDNGPAVLTRRLADLINEADIRQRVNKMKTLLYIAARRDAGLTVGRPRGAKGSRKAAGRHPLTKKKREILRLLDLGISKASIARLIGVNRSNLLYFIRTRGMSKYMKAPKRKWVSMAGMGAREE